MKRAVTGGAHRGPVAPTRQRRTIRFVQILLVLISGALMTFAGYSYGRVDGYRDGAQRGAIDAPREPSIVQPAVLVILGGVTIAAAGLLSDRGGVRMPTPARLEELAGRAEGAALTRAEEVASEGRAEEVAAERGERSRKGSRPGERA